MSKFRMMSSNAVVPLETPNAYYSAKPGPLFLKLKRNFLELTTLSLKGGNFLHVLNIILKMAIDIN